mgnify:CR=1 FL=1
MGYVTPNRDFQKKSGGGTHMNGEDNPSTLAVMWIVSKTHLPYTFELPSDENLPRDAPSGTFETK